MVFIDAGYSPLLFYDLSLGEVNDMLESYAIGKQREQRIREANLKDQVTTMYNQALQIGNVLAAAIDSKNVKIRPLSEYYPGLFRTPTEFTEQENEGDEHKLSPEAELHKARMDDFAFRHNMAKRRGENSGWNDFGETASNYRGSNKELLRGAEESTESD